MTIKKLTSVEAAGFAARVKAAAKTNWATGGDEAVVRAFLETDSAEHAQRVENAIAEFPARGKTSGGVRDVVTSTREAEPWRTSNGLRDRIIGQVPHDFLALRIAPDPRLEAAATRVRVESWEGVVSHDNPLWYHFDPLYPATPSGCTWNETVATPSLPNWHWTVTCTCYRCRIRDDLGPPNAWRLAFSWAELHCPDGTALDRGLRWDPLRRIRDARA